MSFAFINQKNQYLFLKFIQNINVNMNEKRNNFLFFLKNSFIFMPGFTTKNSNFNE